MNKLTFKQLQIINCLQYLFIYFLINDSLNMVLCNRKISNEIDLVKAKPSN